MTKAAFLQSNLFKIMVPLVVVVGAIVIWKGGIGVGQWLYELWH